MIDLVLWAASKADMLTWGKTNPPANPLVEEQDDGEGGTINVARPGLEFGWWAGSGDFMTAAGTYDGEGIELTPPTFASGVVALLRVHSDFWENDRLEVVPADPEDVKEWERSKIAQHLRDNGTPGTMAGSIPYYELNGVRIIRRTDVNTFLAANTLPGHTFL